MKHREQQQLKSMSLPHYITENKAGFKNEWCLQIFFWHRSSKSPSWPWLGGGDELQVWTIHPTQFMVNQCKWTVWHKLLLTWCHKRRESNRNVHMHRKREATVASDPKPFVWGGEGVCYWAVQCIISFLTALFITQLPPGENSSYCFQ